MIKLLDLLREAFTYDNDVWYHGSPSGDLRGGTSGLHLGTYKAAKQALEARIGIPVEGEWDGKGEYGKTLLCGKKTIQTRGSDATGFNCSEVEEEDFYPTKSPYGTDYMRMSMKPAIKAYKILCPMVNTKKRPYTDNYANLRMRRELENRSANYGMYYRNDSEDYLSISIVVPNGNYVREVR